MDAAALVAIAKEIAQDDGVATSLISDALWIHHANAGQWEFCQRTNILHDSATVSSGGKPVAQLDTEADKQDYELHPAVIDIVEFSVVRGNYRLYEEDAASHIGRPDALRMHGVAVTSGAPLGYRRDRQSGYLSFTPTPDGVYTIGWTAVRGPLTDMTAGPIAGTPEIPARWHMALAEYMVGQVETSADPDVKDEESAQRHKAEFERWVLEGKRYVQRMVGGARVQFKTQNAW